MYDFRHAAITKLAESGAGDETIMAIAGHVSRAMLSRYAHIRTEAKRLALEAIATKRAGITAKISVEAAVSQKDHFSREIPTKVPTNSY